MCTFSEDKNSACNLPLAERSLYILGCLQRPEEGRSSPVASEDTREQRGLWGTTEKLPHLKGHQLPCSCWLLPSRKGAQGYKTLFLFLFSSREATDRFFFCLDFFNRKRLDLYNILRAKHNSLAGHSLQLLVSSIINTLVITASDVY